MTDPWRYENEARESGYAHIAGVDEAGRGPLAGPVVAAAVVLPREFILDGIQDSKKMSPRKREHAWERIMNEAISVGIGIIESDIIDKINILQATYRAMKAALNDLGVAFDYVMVDGNRTVPDILTDQKALVDGDALCASISAASIIAKVTRDHIMDDFAREYPLYGFEKHKGYGTPEHLRALDDYGICRIHRKSFSPVARKVESGCPQPNLF